MSISCTCDDYDDYDDIYMLSDNYETANRNCKCYSCGKNIKKGDVVRSIWKYLYIDDGEMFSCLQNPDNPATKELAKKKTPYELEWDGEEFYVIWGYEFDFDGKYRRNGDGDYYCEECADLSFSLEALGYCYMLNFPLKRQWQEYLDEIKVMM